MGVADLPTVLEVERAAYPRPPWSQGMFEEELRRPDRVYLLVELEGSIVAFGGALVVGDDAEILTVAVLPAARRRGIARQLVGALLAAARDRGASSVTLEVRTGNLAAQNLYRQFGFVPVGERPGYYQDGEDALIMWKV